MMNWINAFELLCYVITAVFLFNICLKKSWSEFWLFVSAAFAGFALELLAVRVTDIYHYSPDFYISIGFKPYQFPFFGGLMWGGLTVCALRIAGKLGFGNLMTAFVTGWLIVSMDILLDVAAIRLSGGFWVWEGREITLDVTHHMFMSVIWVNFLGYLFETPAITYMTLRSWGREEKRPGRKILLTIGIGLAGVAIVGVASLIALWLNSVTDEWFSCIAFILLWSFILVRLILQVFHKRGEFSFAGRKDWTLLAFWAAMYGYCMAALFSLGIVQAVPWYGVLSVMLAAGTMLLCLVSEKKQEYGRAVS